MEIARVCDVLDFVSEITCHRQNSIIIRSLWFCANLSRHAQRRSSRYRSCCVVEVLGIGRCHCASLGRVYGTHAFHHLGLALTLSLDPCNISRVIVSPQRGSPSQFTSLLIMSSPLDPQKRTTFILLAHVGRRLTRQLALDLRPVSSGVGHVCALCTQPRHISRRLRTLLGSPARPSLHAAPPERSRKRYLSTKKHDVALTLLIRRPAQTELARTSVSIDCTRFVSH
jgi:hypothetical protein